MNAKQDTFDFTDDMNSFKSIVCGEDQVWQSDIYMEMVEEDTGKNWEVFRSKLQTYNIIPMFKKSKAKDFKMVEKYQTSSQQVISFDNEFEVKW